MTNTVYVLGAGFSMAVSANVASEYKMPSLSELSDAVLNRLRQIPPQPRAGGSIKTLEELASDTVEADLRSKYLTALQEVVFESRFPGAGTPLVKNFERWLSYLVDVPPWLSPADQARNRGAFLELSRFVYDVLKERQQLTLLHQKEVCPDWLVRLVRHWHMSAASVITFNYDQLVELAWLTHADPQPPRTRSWDLYPATLTPLSARVGITPPVYSVPGGFQLFKLHGSLGWWYSGPDSPPGDTVYDEGVNGRAWNIEGLFSAEQLSISMFGDLQPMIVPPAAVKSPYYNNSLLRAMWKSAADYLRMADELVIIGFSLPPTDMLVSSMLCTNVPKECVITPVDYSDSIIERICETFDINPNDSRLNKQYAGLGDGAISRFVEDRV